MISGGRLLLSPLRGASSGYPSWVPVGLALTPSQGLRPISYTSNRATVVAHVMVGCGRYVCGVLALSHRPRSSVM